MATVKRKQNGKVILKDGKVSCSCCGECCMYPAQALADGLYSADDLPDAVILNYDLVEDFELTRSGSEFIGGIYKIALGTLPNSTETQWLLYVNNERDNNNPCLITGDGGLTPGDDIVEDQFADTYTVNANLEYPWEEQGSPITIPVNGSFTLERFSLCEWRSSGFPSNAPFFVLYYVNLPRTDNPILKEGPQWSLEVFYLEYDPGLFASSVNFKEDPQNSPVGSYGSGVYGTVSIS